ncbi:septum formation protein Maf [Lachnospiraceae bacterium MD308]|nr:septum formation protein Maf [Lachnospiraceae bacterium MD308]MCI8579842.1 septum formation protein Maf [Dorea sp.]
MRYILASASPRRKELLKKTGISFEIIPSSIEERITKTIPSEIVMELAEQKARAVYESLLSSGSASLIADVPESRLCGAEDGDLTVIGADTIVVYRGEILGKPADKSEAYDMLSLLSDRTHQVYTGVSLIIRKHGKISVRTFYEKTDVTFYPIHKDDLHIYIESGDPLDKAGAYGIQGDFAIHVKEIKGDYNNVVGLPIGRLYQELQQIIYS